MKKQLRCERISILFLCLVCIGLVSISQFGSNFGPSASARPTNASASAVSGSEFVMVVQRVFLGHRFFQGPGIPPTPNHHKVTCLNWVVVSTVGRMSQAIRQATELADWCVVVVADKRSLGFSDFVGNSSWRAGRHFYLTPEDQVDAVLSRSPLSMPSQLPWNHFGRKNFGYLFAIGRGAARIYDLDDDNIIKQNGSLPEVPLACVRPVLQPSPRAPSAVNPYPSLGGAGTAWPRGFPMGQIKRSFGQTRLRSAGWTNSCGRVGIMQSLADNDPDVDAIYRLTSPHLPLNFNQRPFPMALDGWAVSPFNAQATLFWRDCFWGLLLPVSVHGRVSDIWRGYIAQVRTAPSIAHS